MILWAWHYIIRHYGGPDASPPPPPGAATDPADQIRWSLEYITRRSWDDLTASGDKP